jgi:signal transduction histidine kinase
VTSHLIHGLKNPLSGLRNFVAQGRPLEPGHQSDWELAAASTQRMQNLIDRVVRVLQEQQTVVEYELSYVELLEMLDAKFSPAAKARGVAYRQQLHARGNVSNRDADLLLLILENLVQNAIEATRSGESVELRAFDHGPNLMIEVEDHGPGLPSEVAERLFTPCHSSKRGGSGIGLAISRQLAVHLGATLGLKKSTETGCCFQLLLPKRTSRTDTGSASQTPALPNLAGADTVREGSRQEQVLP